MLSDFAYLDVAILLTVAFPVLLHRIKATDGFNTINFHSLKRVELKTVAVVLIFLSMLLIIVYDWIAATVKYRQGFWVDPATGSILTRPREKYDAFDRRLFPSVAVLQNLGWTLKCTALFLVMALWNHMSKAVLNKPFMSSAEFKLYAVYSLISLAMYPFLQVWYYFSRDVILSNVMPLFLHVFQCFLLVITTQVANSRFKKLLLTMSHRSSASQRIIYYSQMNNYMTLCVFLEFIGLGGIAIDVVTTNKLFYNKFLLDLFSKTFNVGFCTSYIVAIMILCPAARTSVSAAVSQPQSPATSPKKMRASQNLPAIERRGSRRMSTEPQQTPILQRDTRGYFKLKIDTANQSGSVKSSSSQGTTPGYDFRRSGNSMAASFMSENTTGSPHSASNRGSNELYAADIANDYVNQ